MVAVPNGSRRSGDLACDPPVADEPHHLARELPAVRAPLPATGFDRGDRRDEAAHEQEVERDRELRDTRRRGGRGVDDPDPALGGGAHVDVVDPDPGACDQRKRRRGSEEVGGDLRTAPDDHRRRPRQIGRAARRGPRSRRSPGTAPRAAARARRSRSGRRPRRAGTRASRARPPTGGKQFGPLRGRSARSGDERCRAVLQRESVRLVVRRSEPDGVEIRVHLA